jgi:hypothetical protein
MKPTNKRPPGIQRPLPRPIRPTPFSPHQQGTPAPGNTNLPGQGIAKQHATGGVQFKAQFKTPTAPPVYRPQPVPKVLQTKLRPGSSAAVNPSQTTPSVLQRTRTGVPARVGNPQRPAAGYRVIQRAEALAERKRVVSGHGRFDENFLATEGRKKLPYFIVPEGVTVVLYAPSGATLDNPVANMIEQGNYPTAEQVVLKKQDSSGEKEVPKPYPYVFRTGDEVINYSVGPPNRLKIEGDAYCVSKKTSLKDIVEDHHRQGYTTIHFACCCAGSAAAHRDLFDMMGWYVTLRR